MERFGAVPGLSLGASPDESGAGECDHLSDAVRVLIVDDHPGFRASAGTILPASWLAGMGEAADGESGVRVARDLSPDLVLLDVQLPDITGFEVVRRVHSEPDPPAIVLISSRDACDYGSRIGRSGALGFISKAELSAPALRAVLEGSQR